MPWILHGGRRPVMSALVFGLSLCVGLGTVVPARPQLGTYPYPSGTGASSSNSSGRSSSNPNLPHTLGSDFPVSDPNFSHRQLVARREDLKKHMVENAARLLVLTRDLQTELRDREASEADAKRLDEIAKLARTVRDQMRQ